MKTKNKKAAIELSIGTIVIIVLAMTMLILGIVLVTNIMKGGIDLADVTNQKVRAQIVTLFTKDNSNIVIQTGANRIAEVKAGGDPANINLGARPLGGGVINDRADLYYKLSYQSGTESTGNCDDLGVDIKKDLFQVNIEESPAKGSKINFDMSDASSLYATIDVSAPDGTPTCTQKIYVSIYEKGSNDFQGSEYFIIKVTQGGIFS